MERWKEYVNLGSARNPFGSEKIDRFSAGARFRNIFALIYIDSNLDKSSFVKPGFPPVDVGRLGEMLKVDALGLGERIEFGLGGVVIEKIS